MFRHLSYLLILLTPFVVGCSDRAQPEQGAGPPPTVGAWIPVSFGWVMSSVPAISPVPRLGAGLVVPGFVDLVSIADLAGQGERIGGRILGIEADADLMTATRGAIEHYGLSGLELMASAKPLMLAMLQTEIAAGHWAVATGWTPHWLFAAQDIRFLDDPSGIYGGEEQLVTIARKGLRVAKPDATTVLDNFNWTLADLNRVMLLNRAAGADPAANARQWVLDNLDQ